MENVFGVMMAGGASSRFFPENKVFADPTGCGRSMVQQACDRLTMESETGTHKTFVPAQNFYCVTGLDMADEMKKHLPHANVLAEPGRRNTLPAILWTMAHIEKQTPDGTLIVVTGDHVIRDLDIFRSALALAVELTCEKKAIVTVGISPSKDATEWTAFGAIKSDLESKYKDACKIIRFQEKPSLDQAEGMIAEGCWNWNSGMFVFKMQLMRELLEEFQPELFQKYSAIVNALKADNADAAKEAFLSIIPSVPDPSGSGKKVDASIDYAIMMRLTDADYKGSAEGFCIPGTFYWMDIGSWNALRTVCESDAQNNVVVGDATLQDCSSVISLNALSQKLTVKGTKGIVVVAGSGWILLCKEELAQAVKQVRSTALGCADAIVCEQCEVSAITVCGESSGVRVAAVGISKGKVEFTSDGVCVEAE
eukprot:TRINITY_DN12489_c0_g1_i1.p1 TRINITY_DN12489_c0_g1~~TRINITY_DN12489_c0_g1_i1.p1  ORF type:complete len:424 (+),score=105.28 TRINITY_DN12489_c0_g1_i1:66-1337(+)